MNWIAAFVAALPLLAADAPPSWLMEAAAQTTPAYPSKVTRAALLQEEHLTVAPDGKRVIRDRGALKVLQRDRGAVTASRSYNTKSGRIREFQGWVIAPDGKTTTLSSKDHVVDIALSQNETYGESRAKVLRFPKDAAPGSVLGWEIVEEEKTIFTQYSYEFQQTDPALISRFVLTMPQGWEARGTMINADALAPRVAGDSSTWELRNLPWIADEDYRPDTHTLVPRLGVSYFPSSSANSALKPLSSWPAVSIWLTTLVDPPAEVTAAIRDKGAELSRSAKTPLELMRAIATFVQQTSYVSVQMNLTRAGGYTPNRAEQILIRNYGDCKDKTTLMRALLKAANIESFMTVLYSGDRDFVRAEWPSPFQFNHAIIAIRVPADTKLAAVTDHPKLGRLLFFDPTDPMTPFGELPEEEQGSRALVVAGDAGDLVQLPLLPPDRNHVETVVTGEITPTGALKAKLVRTYSGQGASFMRARLNDDMAVKQMFERSLSYRLGGLSVSAVSLKPLEDQTQLQAVVDFDVNQFGQLMQDRLLVVSPGNIMPDSDYLFSDDTRTLPVKIRARSRRNSVRLTFPPGFGPDEVPSPVKVNSEYGSYAASWAVKDGEIVFDQTVRYKDLTVAADGYSKIKSFFDEFAGAQGSSVVLIRKD